MRLDFTAVHLFVLEREVETHLRFAVETEQSGRLINFSLGPLWAMFCREVSK